MAFAPNRAGDRMLARVIGDRVNADEMGASYISRLLRFPSLRARQLPKIGTRAEYDEATLLA